MTPMTKREEALARVLLCQTEVTEQEEVLNDAETNLGEAQDKLKKLEQEEIDRLRGTDHV